MRRTAQKAAKFVPVAGQAVAAARLRPRGGDSARRLGRIVKVTGNRQRLRPHRFEFGHDGFTRDHST